MRETGDFTDPMVPLGKGKWQRASEVRKDRLTEVIAFLKKNLKADKREGIHEYNAKVLAGAEAQLEKKG